MHDVAIFRERLIGASPRGHLSFWDVFEQYRDQERTCVVEVTDAGNNIFVNILSNDFVDTVDLVAMLMGLPDSPGRTLHCYHGSTTRSDQELVTVQIATLSRSVRQARHQYLETTLPCTIT